MFPVVLEIDPTKSFREDASMLLCRLVLYGNFPRPKKIANKVETHVYVFTSGRAQEECFQSVLSPPGCPQGPLCFPHSSQAQ